jgi:phospholipid-binding lipoprotein MlaA
MIKSLNIPKSRLLSSMFMRQQTPFKSSLHAAPLLATFICAWVLQGCATSASGEKIEKGLDASENIAKEKTETEAQSQSEAEDKDPLEGFNRAMYSFNDKVDNYVAEPITNAYKWVTPDFVQKGISNFFTNTKSINVVLNDVFQGKFTQSAEDTGRFLVNTTVGVVGLFDVASHIGLNQHDEDFDQTLAVWGVPKGAYLVLPLVGPSTTRGIPGSVVDAAANPITYVGMPAQVLAMLNARANAEGALKFIDEASLDPYVFTRESFLQWRDYLSTDGTAKAAAAVNDEFEDELEENLDEQPSATKPAAKVAPPASQSKAAEGGAVNAVAASSPPVGSVKSEAKAVDVVSPVSKPSSQLPAAIDKVLEQSASGKDSDASGSPVTPSAAW